ncbi:hypothetical protein Cni_G15678 [Canna indica]|uniref:PPC domain-containing protein n=1 Tax=Canna indica TaxID=4628 RepID=A0AAQ3QF54_9LILI|nr:hypothetical protein Cni_G15678 [Canna indica]
MTSVTIRELANRWWAGNAAMGGVDTTFASAPSLHLSNPHLSLRHDQLDHSNSSGSNNNRNSDEDANGDVNSLDIAEAGSRGGGGGGGGSLRRPRGRPPGSKNRPKPPVVIARESTHALRSNVFEIASGADIVDAVSAFARRRHRGVTVLSASGAVTNVRLRQPMGGVVALPGRFEILSLSGAFLPAPALQGANGLTLYMAGAQGQVVGGSVVGELVASGPVMMIAATFANAAYERLPLPEDEEQEAVAAPLGTEQSAGGNGDGGFPGSDQSSMSLFGLSTNLLLHNDQQDGLFGAWSSSAGHRPPPSTY